ncbi:homoserine O-acetyltransferase [Novimethylophilus kurashikiensis]|uniref:Homoserine O-acetyltransferase n=1 Tax=Novimethylophilus kurashikiensis TaxID=1825523 RepID=A0A2R5FDP0_9PROT|nr:DUF6765 family protein [Novimethylophilus kurashikiensis]GBG16035.1 homoserine O-acetyltransferase [Novimethylophilus kurashikiensis]
MQTDMHYYGTYCMARAAGLNDNTAQSIATAAEYVDDCSDITAAELSDGVMLKSRATAHHPIDGDNLDPLSQREIWVPFHFLPGNEGDSHEERLVCRKNSALAREMVSHHLDCAEMPYGVELMGITAHVYADTFSHYGFSGISSDTNRVEGKTIKLHVEDETILKYIRDKFDAFKEKYAQSHIADLVGLGHGSVGTYPDRPYLTWEFLYEISGQHSGSRHNSATFLEACEELHKMFKAYAEKVPGLKDAGGGRSFESIKDTVGKVLTIEGTLDQRCEAWQSAAVSDALFDNPDKAPIPSYNSTWFTEDQVRLADFDSNTVNSATFYSFLMAAKFHRDYVLDELLPKYNLPVIFRL